MSVYSLDVILFPFLRNEGVPDLQFAGDVFHFVIIVCDIDFGIHLSQLCIEQSVAGIYHISDKRQLVEVSVIHHLVVLLGQFHILPFRVVLHEALEIFGVSGLHLVVELFARHFLLQHSLLRGESGLMQLLVALEE